MKRLTRTNLTHNFAWMMCGQGVSFFCQVVYFIMLTRLLGVAQYGIMVGAFALSSLAGQYASVGSGIIFVRYVVGAPQRFGQYWGNIIFMTLCAGGALTVALYFCARFILNPASASLVLVLGLANCVLAPISAECGRVFQAFELMRVAAVINSLTSVVRALTVAGMLLLLHRSDAWHWSLAVLAVSALSTFGAVGAIVVRFGWPRFEPDLFLKHAAEGFGYAFANSTSSVYNDVDKTMLSHYGLNLANGVYSLAYRIVDIASIPLFSLREALLPRLFRLGRTGIEGPASCSVRMMMRMAVPTAAVASVCMFVAAPVIPLLLGGSFTESVSALRWLCLIPVLRSVHQMTGAALTGAGRQKYRTAAQVSAAILNLIVNLWLIPEYSWRGAAWASLITDGSLAVACWMIMEATRTRARECVYNGA